MRLFVAIDPPDPIRQAIEDAVVTPLRDRIEGARWTRPEGRHLTLKFLGEVAEERLEEISGRVAGVAAGHAAFRVAFQEIGGFPNLRRPRVLWIGVGQGLDEAREVAGHLDEVMEPLGFRTESRPFTCHLTLARLETPRPISEKVEVEVPRTVFEVSDIVLFRSRLHPKGARYETIERFALGGR